MQTKDSRRLELRPTLIFLIVAFLLFPRITSAEQGISSKERIPIGQRIKEAEERARIDRALAAQEKGEPIEAKRIIKKPLETSPDKITKKLETRPMKRMKTKDLSKMPTKRTLTEKEARSAILRKAGEGGEREQERKGQFEPDLIQKRLETDDEIRKRLK